MNSCSPLAPLPAQRRRARLVWIGAALWLFSACAQVGKFVWVDEYAEPPTPADKGYVIAPGDIIQVRVFNEDQMSTRARVRSDGKISLPLLNDVEAAGYAPSALAQNLQTRLKSFINTPLVTVSLEEPKLLLISVLGEVARTGVYSLEAGAGVLQALASAGGMTEYAHRDRIFVLRQTPGTTRIRFTYEALSRTDGRSASFRLRSGDVVVVE